MTLLVAMVDPPREGLVLPGLADETPLTAAEVVDLYRAMAADVLRAGAESGGGVLVNYRPDDLLPPSARGEASSETAVRELAADALDEDELGDVRFEVQVGSTYDARVGNAVTHLLEREGETSVAVVDPVVPLVGRSGLDSAAMKLRRRDVVLGPATEGRVYYAAFSSPIDFAGAYETPAVLTLTERARERDLDVDFLSPSVAVRTGEDLLTLLALVRARRRAGRVVPSNTAALLDDLPIRVDERDGRPTLVRE